ncbi:hypothetical protein VTJ49DRAFT_4391 [Mycothermus thermophilus]|uniref:Uncharacterized protein n=1 Tax=Humicola insolens TaxID=85995 RepID=A0ABR3V5I8_HUMIN
MKTEIFISRHKLIAFRDTTQPAAGVEALRRDETLSNSQGSATGDRMSEPACRRDVDPAEFWKARVEIQQLPYYKSTVPSVLYLHVLFIHRQAVEKGTT